MMSRERVTLFTQISSDPKITAKLSTEFCFKGAPDSKRKCYQYFNSGNIGYGVSSRPTHIEII